MVQSGFARTNRLARFGPHLSFDAPAANSSRHLPALKKQHFCTAPLRCRPTGVRDCCHNYAFAALTSFVNHPIKIALSNGWHERVFTEEASEPWQDAKHRSLALKHPDRVADSAGRATGQLRHPPLQLHLPNGRDWFPGSRSELERAAFHFPVGACVTRAPLPDAPCRKSLSLSQCSPASTNTRFPRV